MFHFGYPLQQLLSFLISITQLLLPLHQLWIALREKEDVLMEKHRKDIFQNNSNNFPDGGREKLHFIICLILHPVSKTLPPMVTIWSRALITNRFVFLKNICCKESAICSLYILDCNFHQTWTVVRTHTPIPLIIHLSWTCKKLHFNMH